MARPKEFHEHMESFKTLTQEQQNRAIYSAILSLREVIMVEGGDIGDSLLRTFYGAKAGNDDLEIGSLVMGWEAALFATGHLLAIGARAGYGATSESDWFIGNFVVDHPDYVGNQNTIGGHGAAGALRDGYNNTIFGNGAAQWAHEIKRCVISGLGAASGQATESILNSVILGEDSAGSATGDVVNHLSAGWEASKGANAKGGVHLGHQAGLGEQEDDTLHIANNKDESLIQGSFANRTAKVNGSLEMETMVVGGVTYSMSVVDGGLQLTPVV